MMVNYLAAISLLMIAAGSGVARAGDDCHVSMDKWQSRDAVQAMATSRGWTVARIKIDDGCYEVRGSDKTGMAFRAKVDPATLAIVRIKHKGGESDHDDDRRRKSRDNEG
ncbi:PepSY domain-containing protein [Ochrobactrum chromiisoli]|uniref:PepSY domain-containing protein n=1 Tax=Ochrobactrum chromiisoli TaxID=2993941 RepID=A0ABT3QSB8_9HYPH|nr:PepSY domain-containing protein [Ochrobactrum chromiisoli]MCX2698533.1 PepSY domain-containing protein [Ochrobactrum chromiisoli]